MSKWCFQSLHNGVFNLYILAAVAPVMLPLMKSIECNNCTCDAAQSSFRLITKRLSICAHFHMLELSDTLSLDFCGMIHKAVQQ